MKDLSSGFFNEHIKKTADKVAFNIWKFGVITALIGFVIMIIVTVLEITGFLYSGSTMKIQEYIKPLSVVGVGIIIAGIFTTILACIVSATGRLFIKSRF